MAAAAEPAATRFLVLIVLAIGASAHADPPGRYPFRSYGSSEGLENLAIHQITQTSNGLIWLATEDGLYSFDGMRFDRIDMHDGLPSNQIFTLLPTARGLWVGTARGLVLVDGDNRVGSAGTGVPPDQVNALAAATDGTIWAATDRGLFRQRGADFELAPSWPGGPSAAVWTGPGGRVSAGRASDVVTQARDGTWTVLGRAAGFGRDRIDAIAQTGDGVLWIRSARFLWSCDVALHSCLERSSELSDVSEIGRLVVDRRGTLWVTTRRGLDHRVDASRWERLGTEQGLPARSVLSTFEDREGSLWIAADQLYQLLGRGLWQGYSARDGFPADTAWTITRTSDGTLLVGSNRGILEGTGETWTTIPDTESFTVQTIVEAGGLLYAAGTEARVLRIERRTGAVTAIGPDRALGADAIPTMVFDGTQLWTGTWNAGLLVMTEHLGQRVWRREPLPGGQADEDINQLLLDRAGRLWAAGDDGLAVRDQGIWRRFTRNDGFADTAMAYVVERASGEICVAYAEAFGLTCFRYASTLTGLRHMTRANGLTSDKIYLLGEDQAGRLYAGMGVGVDVIDGATIEYFSTTSGLVGDDCAARAFLADRDGDVLIGTTRGVARFAAGRYEGPPAPVAPIVLSLALGGRIAPSSEAPRAPEDGTTSMTARFATPTFANRGRLVQQVRLLPLEDDWRVTEVDEARYAQLPYGEYVFEVRVRLATGAYGPVTRVGFTVWPAWWQTTVFRVLGLSVLLLLAFAIILWSVRWSTAREARRIVARSEASLHALIEQTPDSLLVHRDGTLIYVNKRALVQFGCAHASELLGTPAIALIHPDEHAIIDQRRRALLTTGEAAPVRETLMVRKDGSSVTCEVSAIVVEFGGAPAIMTIIRDCTERKALEARVMLSDRMASIGTLAAGVAHEVNNPLAYVKSNLILVSEQLASSPSSALITEAVADALEGATRVENIIKGLKAFSRVDRAEPVSIDVHAALELAVRMTTNEIRHRCILTTDYAPVPAVLADSTRLGQVFVNLILNAAQAFPETTTARNEIRIATRTDTDGRAVIEVRDNGRGMTPDVLKRVFEPFFTTKDVGQGTGLGLSICHGIVHSFGGEITVESSPMVGSVFRVSLPGTTMKPARVIAERDVTPMRCEILVIDDDQKLLASIGRMLGRQHEVVLVQSATGALAELERGGRFDVILCDLMMPGLTGMDLHAELSVRLPDQARRMLFMTGGAFTSAAQEFLEAATTRWIEKPFVAADLRRQIAAITQVTLAA